MVLLRLQIEDRQQPMLENAALRHQLAVLKRSVSRPKINDSDAFAERVIGTLRRECTDHRIPLGQRHLLRTLRQYVGYYNTSRPHQSLDRNSPIPREVEAIGEVCARPVLGGLHHRYFRAT